MRTFALLLISLVPLALADNDAGSGGDAPNSRGDAIPANASFFGGHLDPSAGDTADWYVVHVPAGKGIHLEAGSVLNGNDWGGVSLVVLTPIGDQVADLWFGNWVSQTDFVAPEDTLLVGVTVQTYWTSDYTADYNISFTPFELPSVGVQIGEVHDVPLQIEGGATPAGLHRAIPVTLVNSGLGEGVTHLHVAIQHPTEGSERVLFDGYVDMLPGATWSQDVLWDSTGEAGDVRIVASAQTPFDTNPRDDSAERGSFVLVGGTGQGVDAFDATLFQPPILGVGPSAGVSYHDGPTAYAGVGLLLAGAGISVSPLQQGQQVCAGANAVGEGVGTCLGP